MNPSEKHILEIDSVELSFGDRVILSSVYLAVETGGATALLGRNGSGKSCLMKILCGALRPGFRSMRIDGKWYDRFGSSQVRYLPQQGFTPGWLTVEAVLRDFGLEWDDLTVWFPIFGKLRKAKIRTLSGGERRILECFVILRSRSLFAVLDEPFSQVAPLHVVTLKALIRAEKRNKGILLTDHMYRHVTDVADRLYVLANGQTYLTQDAEDLVRYGYLLTGRFSAAGVFDKPALFPVFNCILKGFCFGRVQINLALLPACTIFAAVNSGSEKVVSRIAAAGRKFPHLK
ncbi:ATP-binding cassette domain-containing protein [Alistipes putredinis]|uniref:ATP-binding cassette domain-containing protein n=4 Tax=Alistipes putredinis TaxID=28117 RepID=UPI003AB42732